MIEAASPEKAKTYIIKSKSKIVIAYEKSDSKNSIKLKS